MNIFIAFRKGAIGKGEFENTKKKEIIDRTRPGLGRKGGIKNAGGGINLLGDLNLLFP